MMRDDDGGGEMRLSCHGPCCVFAVLSHRGVALGRSLRLPIDMKNGFRLVLVCVV